MRLSSLAVGAALLLAACATPDYDGDRLMARLETEMAASATAADAGIAEQLSTLALPVTDHLSALRYCAFRLRNIAASSDALHEAARRGAQLNPEAFDGPPETAAKAVDFGALFPTLRDTPVFTIAPRKPHPNGGRVHIAADTGSCTIMTLGEPRASAAAAAWLNSPASGWERAGRSNTWTAYRVRSPTLMQRDLRIFEARLSETARRQDISAVHVVAMTGLP